MSSTSFFWIGAALLILVVAYFWYVNLIQRRNRARQALSSIDVQLNKRHDLIPNTLKLARQFMAHERQLMEEVIRLRGQTQQPYDASKADEVRRHLEAESQLHTGLRRLFAVAENYPELRSSDTIIEAQRAFNEVEGHIAAARRFYNASVTRLNNAVEIFPGSLIASLVGVESMPFFELQDEAVREPIDVDNYFNEKT